MVNDYTRGGDYSSMSQSHEPRREACQKDSIHTGLLHVSLLANNIKNNAANESAMLFVPQFVIRYYKKLLGIKNHENPVWPPPAS